MLKKRSTNYFDDLSILIFTSIARVLRIHIRDLNVT